MSDLIIVRNDITGRYEGSIDGILAGFTVFKRVDNVIIFPHTVVYEEFEGRGIASAIIQYALDEIRTEGNLKIIPNCSFVAVWVEQHPDYLSLVYSD